MKFLTYVLMLFFLGIATTSFGQLIGSNLPSATVTTLDGQKGDIGSFINNDKITVLSFWATWCAPCKRELDAISELLPEWKEEGLDVEIVAVTIDDARMLPRVKPMVMTKGWEFMILSDKEGNLKQAMNFNNVPYTFIVKDGKIVYAHDGYSPGDEDDLEDKLFELANGDK